MWRALTRAPPVGFDSNGKDLAFAGTVSESGDVRARAGEAVHRADIELPHDIETGDAFRLIALSCLRHLTLNESALAEGHAEGVHQMRVATRRLRAAIALFDDLFDEREIEPIKVQLRWLTAQLAQVREYDVLLERSRSLPKGAAAPGSPAAARLIATLRQRRAEKLTEAQRAVDSDRYRELVVDTTRWILSGPWTRDPARRRARQRWLLPRARKLLKRRSRRVRRELREPARLTFEQLHELRIKVKKLHYGVQFFASMFPGHSTRRKKFLRILERLQAGLGELNDAHVHRALAPELLASTVPSGQELDGEAAFALGLLQGQEDAHVAPLIRSAKRDGRKLSNLRPFWRH